MFCLLQKRDIADKVQQILRDTQHPELPEGEIQFHLHVAGAESWSWADINNNGAVLNPTVNPWNERNSQRNKGNMKILNPKNQFYRNHADNVVQIIVSADNRDLAGKLVDLYVEVVNGTSDDPRSVAPHLKEPA